MQIAVFDTETTGLEKPFCYNIGYKIFDTVTGNALLSREYVVEQIWHNIALFSTAYYAEKRPIYVNDMRARKILMEKFGYITQRMIRDFKNLEVEGAYAFNSGFDDRVFQFNSEFFKVINPFDNVPIFDIRGYVHKKIAFTNDYQDFCEKHELFTESGNYSTTAESVFKFLTDSPEFVEAHTALADTDIEADILFHCIAQGCEYQQNYKTYQSIPRKVGRPFQIVVDKEVVYQGEYVKKRMGKKTDTYRFYTE